MKIFFVDSVEADAQIGLGKISKKTIYLKRIWLSFKQGVGDTVTQGCKLIKLLTYLNMTASLKLINFVKYLMQRI